MFTVAAFGPPLSPLLPALSVAVHETAWLPLADCGTVPVRGFVPVWPATVTAAPLSVQAMSVTVPVVSSADTFTVTAPPAAARSWRLKYPCCPAGGAGAVTDTTGG